MLKKSITAEPSPSLFSLQQKTISTFTPSDESFSTHLKLNNHHQAEDSELSIFDAQKYFNESNNGDSRMISKRVSPTPERISDFSSLPRFSSASSSVDGYGRNYRTRSFHATPTASSEASWNSQTGLLSNPPGAIAVSMRNLNEKKKSSSSATKWLLGRKCPCSGKNSVQVKLSEPTTRSRLNHKSDQRINIERQIIPDCAVSDRWLQRQQVLPISHKIIPTDDNRFATTSINHHRVLATPVTARPFSDGTSGFTFPILNQTTTTTTTSSSSFSPIRVAPPPPTLDEPPRDSLEVFRPPDDPIPTNTTVVEHQRRQSFTFPASPKSRMTITEDDIASDASSDLFEIESFSTTQTTPYQMYNHRRDSMDEAAIFHARRLRHSLDECYEPSEVSIDWSVTTAEGFDKASVTNFSEVDEMMMMMTTRHHETEMSSGGKRRGGGGGLLSCRCEKAVSVGPPPVKCLTTEGQKGENSTMKHVSSRPPIANKPPLARSHSARLSLPFAT